MTEYLDFEIEIGSGIGRAYPIEVIRSPGGEAREQMVFPFDELALDSRLKDLQIALLRSGGQRRLLLTPQEQTIQDFGQKLFSALMTGEVRSLFDVSQREASRQGKGLRIKLRIQPPELASLPWEFLFDTRTGEYVCLSTQTPIIRYLEIPQVIQPLAIAPPLHVLGVTASPIGLESLDIENEKRRVGTALQDLIETKQFEITWLEHATWRTLQRAMRGGPWHILHFVGHGGFDRVSDEGILAFEDESGGLNRLPATQLARLLADHTTLRLVILNSCEGAQGGNSDVFSSTASILVRHGLPAVLAMQYPITDRAAIEFSRGFYEAIADGLPVDAAVAEARKSISFGVTNTLEWGTPVLFMRTPDGVLFRPETTTKKAFDRQMEIQKREQARRESEALQTQLAAEKAEHEAAEKAAREQAKQEAQYLATEAQSAAPALPPAGAFPGLSDSVRKLLGLQKHSSPPPSYSTSAEPPMEEQSVSFHRRVLNAGFSKKHAKDILGLNQALINNHSYDLLVDIGPRWQELTSLVVENKNIIFPEEFLPNDASGYLVRVVFVSEDFMPQLVSAEMWVPTQSGQSYPYIHGERASAPGPVYLEVCTPKLENNQSQIRAHGRLCIYFKGQLIQSAMVSVGIAKDEDLKLEEPNKIEVDYVLTSNLADLSECIGNRRAQIQPGKEARPVSVSLTLNDDGSGRHRILATYHIGSHEERTDQRPTEESTVPPAWAPYDPQATQQTLIEFRKVIAECYKDLDQNYGKPRKQFGYDMLELAKLGDQLRVLAMGDMDVSGTGLTVALWRRELLDALKTATVIQIARTGPANYVFPWALVYAYPMPGPNYELCQVIEEWNESGIREKDPGMTCPYQDKEWHQENIICPYGFWGLKHIIEQPPGAIHKQDGQWNFDVSDTILARKDVGLGVGVTYDRDQAARDQHLARLVDKMKAHCEPNQPAHDRGSVLEMLRAPEIVYFLCHGEIDPNQIPYLSIGEHINNPDYEIFPNTLEQWSLLTKDGLDLAAWQAKRPLVFINGCHTAELKPGVVLNFVSAFSDLGASGVIGTEVSVLADMAMVIGEAILGRVANGMEIGQAVREMRWEMLNRGNLLGLAYTPYSLANLHIERRL